MSSRSRRAPPVRRGHRRRRSARDGRRAPDRRRRVRRGADRAARTHRCPSTPPRCTSGSGARTMASIGAGSMPWLYRDEGVGFVDEHRRETVEQSCAGVTSASMNATSRAVVAAAPSGAACGCPPTRGQGRCRDHRRPHRAPPRPCRRSSDRRPPPAVTDTKSGDGGSRSRSMMSPRHEPAPPPRPLGEPYDRRPVAVVGASTAGTSRQSTRPRTGPRTIRSARRSTPRPRPPARPESPTLPVRPVGRLLGATPDSPPQVGEPEWRSLAPRSGRAMGTGPPIGTSEHE